MRISNNWFNKARFGMFVHWGAYSVAARGEWLMNRERIPLEEYKSKYVENFKAENYDPDSWAELAKTAGMKYVVLTTRHHDGFALWNTDTSDYNSVLMGPKEDLVKPFVEAMRRHGLKVGLYYSVADWAHPDYPDAYARDWPLKWHDKKARLRFVEYYHAQLEELMTRYGKIDILWYDGCIPQPLDGSVINKKIKQWQPEILINERNGTPFDFSISEKSLKPKEGLWESCYSLNTSWAFHRGVTDWKTSKQLLLMLIETAKNSGNLLLNIGPHADGSIPYESVKILKSAGQWLRQNGEFLSESSRSPFTWNSCSMVTTRGNSIYIHLHSNPGKDYCYADIANKVVAAKNLGTDETVEFKQKGNRLFLMDIQYQDNSITTIRVDVEGKPQTVSEQVSFWIPE